MVRNQVIDVLQDTFQRYGFQPLATPSVEFASTLMGKYGEEADKLLYTFTDRGGRELGLNYDLTVPTARVLATHQELPKPFKRYQIQPAFRAESPQKGRYRQFTQCDIDVIGSDSALADAEIIAVINDALEALRLPEFTIKLNSRPVLYRLCDRLTIPEDKRASFLQTIDKADKLDDEALDKELAAKGFGDALYSSVIVTELSELESNFAATQSSGDERLDTVYRLALEMGVPGPNLRFSPSIVRGLDYYTSTIFEASVTRPKIGSVSGGGRYDSLIGQLGGPDLPAVGATLGLDRLVDVISELKLWPNLRSSATAMVTVFSPELVSESLKFAQALREDGISTEVYLDPRDRLDKQLKAANRRQIPFVIIIGPEEAAAGTAVLKEMSSGKQEVLALAQLRTALHAHETK